MNKEAIIDIENPKDNDLISRQVVKEQMIKYGFLAPDMTVTEFVEDLPSVTGRRKGHWIDEGQYAEGHSHHAYRCSECGQHIIEFPTRLMDENPYCKYCGAEMEISDADI